MISARSSGSFTIESNVCRQSAFVAPHEPVMLLMPWHFVHSCATASLPGPSGRSATPPPLWPAAGAIVQTKMVAAARSPREIFDMSPPQEDRWSGGIVLETGFGKEYLAKPGFIYTSFRLGRKSDMHA